MSNDAELIATLRLGPEYVYRFVNTDHAAADRIETLVKERDEALEWLSASQGYIADAVYALDKQEKAEARAERLEALLREARSDLAAYVDSDYTEVQRANHPSVERRWRRDMELCRRIDVALKGDDHE